MMNDNTTISIVSHKIQREPARSWKGARIVNASLSTGSYLTSRFIIQVQHSRCQLGTEEANKIKNASSEEEEVSKQQRPMNII